MPRYPTPGEYQEALQFPATAFTDPELQDCEPDTSALGLPQAITGAFATVFPVYTPSGRHALKCFLSDVPDQQARYRALARYLASEQAVSARPYLVPFEYQPWGVRVEGQPYPLLKMGWAQGIALNRFVSERIHDASTLDSLARQWAEMLQHLEAAGIAHGDLQHGNVLVVDCEESVRLVLVDYDTMYAPPLKKRKSLEVGHRNYQHPDRTERDFDPWLDRFAGLVVYVALRACALRPELWERYDTGENVLFRASDFYDPASSYLFKDLAEVEELRGLVEVLRTACLIEPRAVPSLMEARSGVRVNRTVRAAAHSVRSLARQHKEYGEEPRPFAARVFLPAFLLWCIALIVLAWAGLSAAAASVALGGLVVFSGVTLFTYRRQRIIRRRRRLQKEADFFERTIARLRREVDGLKEESMRADTSMEALRMERLTELREQVLEGRLKHHFIGEIGRLPGVPHRLVVRLKMHGIRTAYQATDDRLATVTEVGAQSRARVSQWRAGLISQYVAELPEQLSPAEERRLERHVHQRVESLRTEAERVLEKIRVQERERAEVLARQAALPELSFGHYLRYLFGLAKLPPSRALPPRPTVLPPARRSEPMSPAPVHGDDDVPWWQQS